MKIIKFFILIFPSFCAQYIQAQTANVIVVVKEFKSFTGTIKLQLVNEKGVEVLSKIDKVTSKTYQWNITINQSSEYAINVFHDKNNNNKLDTNVLGIPKEGWGCSNNAKGNLGAPKLKDKLFTVTQNKKLTINLVYY